MSRLGWILIALVLLVGAVAMHAYYRVARVAPVPQFASAEEHFLYGSIGTEAEQGIPYWVWLVLPRVFPEYLPGPGGYAAIGINAHEGHEMPVGLSKVDIGVPRVGVNCAFCHTASVRATPSEPPHIFPGAPAHQAGAQEYRRFLVAAASDPRFTASTILDEISRNVRLSLPDQLLYRTVLIPQARRTLLRLADDGRGTQHDWSRGRADVVSRARFALLAQPADDSVGAADAMPLWHLRRRDADGYYWDRSNTSLVEVVRSHALVEGTSTRWMDADAQAWDHSEAARPSSLRRVLDYLADLAPPKYPFAVDAALASAGEATYTATCAQCHESDGARAHTPIPPAELGTDARRLQAWSAGASAAFNAFGEGHPWQFSRFRAPATGYLAPPLDGVWLSAPYLHNGSVPTLRDLLEPPAARPARFFRGYDVYDQQAVGFVSGGAEAERYGLAFDTARPGNANGGHTYGTTLTPEAKRALLEYLKTR